MSPGRAPAAEPDSRGCEATVHLTHPSGAQGREDLVGAESGPGGQCHRMTAAGFYDAGLTRGFGPQRGYLGWSLRQTQHMPGVGARTG
jgi:hypothetical protein